VRTGAVDSVHARPSARGPARWPTVAAPKASVHGTLFPGSEPQKRPICGLPGAKVVNEGLTTADAKSWEFDSRGLGLDG
jgi:hypothetical protein